jgi:hypothetical protein
MCCHLSSELILLGLFVASFEAGAGMATPPSNTDMFMGMQWALSPAAEEEGPAAEEEGTSVCKIHVLQGRAACPLLFSASQPW